MSVPPSSYVPSSDEKSGGGSKTYGEILRLDELLSMQERISDVPDTLLFITAHQVYELWFMLILYELDLAKEAMDDDAPGEACYRLTRVASIEDVLVTQLRTLETLSPANFAEIRGRLGSSSGFQSSQFREIEFLSGLKDPGYLKVVEVTESERQRLERRLRERSLGDAFEALLQRRGNPDLVALTRDASDPGLLALVERLLDHDEGFARWRALHVLMVERLIGYKPGTGGSEGVAYLRSTTNKRFFPDLWAVRSQL